MPTPEETAAAAAEAAKNTKPWYDGKVDAETVGYMQNRGWHDKPADVVAAEAMKAHRDAEKKLGVPQEQLVRVPDGKDPAITAAFWQKFGAGAKPEDYPFAEFKDKDGKVVRESVNAAATAKAHELMLPKDAAASFVSAIMKAVDAENDATKAAAATALDAERATLNANWGPNVEAYKMVAREGARKLGLDPAAVDALEKTQGYAKTMEALRRVGVAAGEDIFVRNNNTNLNNGVMTVDQAKASKAELAADPVFRKNYLAGGAEEKRKMAALDTIIASAM